MRSPLGSVDSWVGRPRSVLGDAARILSMTIDIFGRDSAHLRVQEVFGMKRSNGLKMGNGGRDLKHGGARLTTTILRG